MTGVGSLRDEAMERLRAYYREQMDDAHRARFDDWVDRRRSAAEGSPVIDPSNPDSARYTDESVQQAFEQLQQFREGVGD